ncbi:MAG: ATP-binding protein involved in chromosome partitioning [Actinomycetota bacterium]|jgi:ATP-binding protein involved in chromosome partitioning
MKIVAVASGKGGVGKSTVSLNLARALAARGAAVGLLDADVYGPDIPLMLGLKQTRELRSWELGRNPRFGRVELEPVEALGLKVMSVGFLVAEAQAMTMPAMLVDLVARQLIRDVRWGALDYLIVDLPPGTADLQQQLFASVELAGAVVVVGPQDAAHLDARKLLTMLRGAGVRVLGAVENMRGLRCPHCGELVDVFPPVAEERSILRELPLLGTVPLDPAYARLNGVPAPFAAIAERVAGALGGA